MTEFIVVDLGCQAEAVANHVRGWTKEQILDWLSQHGEVSKRPHPYDNDLYAFRSRTGQYTAFRLLDDGQLFIIGDHSTSRIS